MRLIDANALMEYCNNLKSKTIDANDIARFPTAYGWISVKDRLPDIGVEVLAAVYGTDVIQVLEGETIGDAVARSLKNRKGHVELGFRDGDGLWTECTFGGPMIIAPRYWMPFLEAPKEGDE